MLLPQFEVLNWPTRADIATGVRLCIYGLFVKIVVADNLAPVVDRVFADPMAFQGTELLFGVLLFGAQIYGDFFGYSTIAIGLARCMGFNLMRNFETPYFAITLSEFWRRWHISLSSFFRDYVYIPFGGNRGGRFRVFTVTVVVFLLSGLWHGAAWGFVLWGLVHGVGVGIEYLMNRKRPRDGLRSARPFTRAVHFSSRWFTTQALVLLSWVFFREPDVGNAVAYLSRAAGTMGLPELARDRDSVWLALIYLVPLVAMDLIWRRTDGFNRSADGTRILGVDLALGACLFLVFSMMLRGGGQSAFIYFQF
jgi:alginate O-acetyltransferase complex protein AlgI